MIVCDTKDCKHFGVSQVGGPLPPCKGRGGGGAPLATSWQAKTLQQNQVEPEGWTSLVGIAGACQFVSTRIPMPIPTTIPITISCDPTGGVHGAKFVGGTPLPLPIPPMVYPAVPCSPCFWFSGFRVECDPPIKL